MYRKWDDYDTGDIVIGKFVDDYMDQKYNKPCWVLEVFDAQLKAEKGEKYVGKHLVLNSCGMLDKAMKKLSHGNIVQVEYQGKTQIEKGKMAGKDSHIVHVDEMEESGGEASEEDVEL